MDILTQTGTKRAVCFDKNRYPLFSDVKDSATHGICLKRARIDEDNIFITDFTQVKKN